MQEQDRFIERKVELRGATGFFLYDTQYPYSSYQVVPMKDEYREKVLGQMRTNHRWPIEAEGRRDFIVVHMGGTVKLDYGEGLCTHAIANAIKDGAKAAAQWWAKHHPEPVDYDALDMQVIGEEEFKVHPTFRGEEPVSIPEDYFAEWKEKNKALIDTLEAFKKAQNSED